MGAEHLKKGAMTPLSRKKRDPAKKIIPKCTDRVFLRYQFGKYQEIPTKNQPKIPNWYTTLDITRVVYWFGIFGWYRLVFSWYFTNRYQRKTRLVHFGIIKLVGAPFSLQKGGLWTLFGALSPPFEGKRVARGFFQKKCFQKLQNRVPAKFYSTKIPTGYTNWLVPVPYRYQQDGQYWDGKQH